MDHDEYVAARYGRLLDYAAELGCPEKVAADQVDWVLEEQRRHIAKADDPDPGVREALARHIAGEPEPRTSLVSYAAIGVVLVLVAAAVVLWRPREPPPLPSMFGYDAATASRVLGDAGYDVVTLAEESCEPRGLVLAADPVPGTRVRPGQTVTLSASAPSDPRCLADHAARSAAWEFVGFVRGEEAPEFATVVTVYLDGEPLALLSGRAAADPRSWTEPLVLIERAATRVVSTRSAMPRLDVAFALPLPLPCGVGLPTSYEDRESLRFSITAPPGSLGDEDCPLTVDLYRDSADRIEAVSIFQPIADASDDQAVPAAPSDS